MTKDIPAFPRRLVRLVSAPPKPESKPEPKPAVPNKAARI